MASRGIDGTGRSNAIVHEGFLRHARHRWARIATTVALIAMLLYAFDDPQPRPGGGTAYGYALGSAATLLILWLTALGVRKRTMTRGRWSLKAWTSAHVYLGLALVVIATLHTGFRFGWNVHTLAYALLLVVVGSGMLGVGLYVALPRALSDNRGETTEPQMIDALHTIDRQLRDAAQLLDQAESDDIRAVLADDPFAAGLLRRLSGRFAAGATQTSLARHRARRASGGDPIEALLERRRATLAKIRRHLHLKALLEGWLYIHVPATFALLAALTAHIVAVFFYW